MSAAFSSSVLASAELDGVMVALYKGPDGKLTVQIDTPTDRHIAKNEVPVIRVNLNDARLWAGDWDGNEYWGETV